MAVSGSEGRVLAGSTIAGAVGLALGGLIAVADRRLIEVLPQAVLLPAAPARVMLAAVISGVITIAVFSLWMRTVTVGLVSVELSPRLLSAYLEDRFQERVTFLMLGAVAYTTVVLIAAPEAAAPPVGVATVALIGLAALTTVLVAMRQAVHSLTVSRVIRDLTDDVLELVEVLPRHGEDEQATVPHVVGSGTDGQFPVHAERMGWVLDIDVNATLAALPPGATAQVVAGTGSFVRPGQPVLVCDQPTQYEAAVRSAFSLRRSRGATDTIGLGIDQLVDVAQHALLANENDALTATEVLLHLTVVFEALLTRSFRPRIDRDEQERTLVMAQEPSTSVHASRAFRRLRAGASRQIDASREVVATMGTIVATARRLDDRETVHVMRREADALLAVHSRERHTSRDDYRELATLVDQLRGEPGDGPEGPGL
ncbi:MAG: DUF2254 family protein [Actinomycetota bacterium]